MLANIDKVKDLIPQKEPFVMVDELLLFGTDNLRSRFKIRNENLFVDNDHFVESGIIENMAQTVALHTGYQFFLMSKEAPTGYLGSIKNVEINRLPKTGEFIETTIEIIQEFMGVTLVDVVVYSREEIIAKCQMKTVLA
jgi:predicted hotdog family 3-hydroxylacyl-ACP dehydratase